MLHCLPPELPDVTSLSFLLSPSAVRHVTYNIDVQYIDVQYSGSPQRETWSKSSNLYAYRPQVPNDYVLATNWVRFLFS